MNTGGGLDVFTYVDGPVISEGDAGPGPTAGGTTVTITGPDSSTYPV